MPRADADVVGSKADIGLKKTAPVELDLGGGRTRSEDEDGEEKRDGEGTAERFSHGLRLGVSWIAVRVTVAVQDDAHLVGLVVGCFRDGDRDREEIADHAVKRLSKRRGEEVGERDRGRC